MCEPLMGVNETRIFAKASVISWPRQRFSCVKLVGRSLDGWTCEPNESQDGRASYSDDQVRLDPPGVWFMRRKRRPLVRGGVRPSKEALNCCA